MVVEEVAEALATDLEAQMAIASRSSRCVRQGLDERDHLSAPLVEDRLGYAWTWRGKGLLH
jgi:hypothetical protein